MMRNWCWLLISFAGVAAAEPPPRLELVFALTRNGSTMAEVVERLEYSGGNYQLTETWKGKGLYSSVSTRAPFHMEGGRGTTSKLVKFQLRPDPLSK